VKEYEKKRIHLFTSTK